MLDARLLVVQCEVADGLMTVVVQGEVDIATVSELRQGLARALDAEPTQVIVDLGPTTFIDGSGMKTIVQARQAAPPDCEMILRSPSRLAQRVIELTGMDQWFMIDRSPPAS